MWTGGWVVRAAGRAAGGLGAAGAVERVGVAMAAAVEEAATAAAIDGCVTGPCSASPLSHKAVKHSRPPEKMSSNTKQ
mgnify:CR=1 FL=1